MATQFFKGHLLLATRKADIVSPSLFYYILSCMHNVHVSASSLGNLIYILLCTFCLFLSESGIFITINTQHTKQVLFSEVEVQLPGNTMTIASIKPINDKQKWQISHLAEVLVFGMSFSLLIIIEKNRESFRLGFPGVTVLCLLLFCVYLHIQSINNSYCSHNFIIKGKRREKGKV